MALASAFALSACSGDYAFTSNLDKNNFRRYFAPSNVKVYQGISPPKHFQPLGDVVGESCQANARQPEPTIDEARTDAQRQVVDLNGNGLIVEQCETLQGKDAAPCVQAVRCYGTAVNLNNGNADD